MRTSARIVAAALAATLSLGLVAGSAQAQTKVVKKSGVTATLTVHDVKNKLGKISDKKWLTLKVVTPPAAHDVVDGYDYGEKAVHWYASIEVKGAKSCNAYLSVPGTDGSSTWVQPIKFESKRSTTTTIGRYVTSGPCKVSAKVVAYRYAQDPALDVDTEFTVKATGYIRNDVKTTKPHASATSVKKNKTTTLSGTVTYQKATATVAYKYRPVAKGSKVVVQFKAKGTSSWKNVKSVKVTGSKGHWSTKVTVKKAGSYRIVSPATSHLQKQVSSAVTIKLKK
ncbi:hypothetical protein [Cellulomonas rhizosphaerae]|uniref:Calcium-binding protein n=1 Tax=Cellulomonas rhizosphaerae TaxID=2293719 RepID=A0A413RNK4_9CELL|nr:hypothetical protein [Cellulomonas rhizosphaerae]RHA43490.1 hypothetical protein D1825_06055 [Cellulomonas rhizosphaerae]